MPTPKIDTGYDTGEYPDRSKGFFGYPSGTATREEPYLTSSYPVHDPAVSCSDAFGVPAGVTITISGGPTTYTFRLSDTDPTHQAVWDFGDGTPRVRISPDQPVQHTYAAPGTYTVTAYCHQTFDTDTVTVLPPPPNPTFPQTFDGPAGTKLSTLGWVPWPNDLYLDGQGRVQADPNPAVLNGQMINPTVLGNDQWVEADFVITADDYSGLWIFLRVPDNADGTPGYPYNYAATIGGPSSQGSGSRIRKAGTSVAGPASPTLNIGTVYTFRAEVTGKTVKTFLNGTPLLTYTDTATTTGGRMGMQIDDTNGTTPANMRVLEVRAGTVVAPSATVIPIKLSGGRWLAQWDNAALRAGGTHSFKAQFTIDPGSNASDERVWTSDLDGNLNYLDVYGTTPAPTGLLAYRVPNPYAMDAVALHAIATAPTLSPIYDVTFHLSGDAGSASDWGDWLSVDGIHDELRTTVASYGITWTQLFASSVTQPANWRDGAYHPVPVTLDPTAPAQPAATSFIYEYVADSPTKMVAFPSDYSSPRLWAPVAPAANLSLLHMEIAAMLGKTIDVAWTGSGSTGKWRVKGTPYFVITPDYGGGTGFSDSLTGWGRTGSFSGQVVAPPGLTAANFTTPARFGQNGAATPVLYKPDGTTQVTGPELWALVGQVVTVTYSGGKYLLYGQPTTNTPSPYNKPWGMTYTVTIPGTNFAPNAEVAWTDKDNNPAGRTPIACTVVSPTSLTVSFNTRTLTTPGDGVNQWDTNVAFYVRNGPTGAWSTNNYCILTVSAPWPNLGTMSADWTYNGSSYRTRPTNFAELQTIVPQPAASPASAWASTKGVACQDGSFVYWTGTAWANGKAP